MTLTAPTPTRSTALATLLACLVLLPLLGHKPLAEWDEAIYAEVSREMLHGGWLVPHWNGQLWLEKPPLMLWITALFFKLFGVTEFWARAGSSFCGIAIVTLLHGWLARTRDLLSAWLSTIILLATLGFLHICHVGETDVLLSLGTCIALIGLSRVGSEDGGGWYLFWTGFAIALMTKGAASVTILITAILVAIIQRWKPKHFGPAFWLGVATFAALALPWHIAMYRLFHDQFKAEYLGLHVFARATEQIEGHRTHWWYYAVVLVASAPPFVLLYPVAVYRGLRRRALQPWAIFSLATLVFFTFIQTRLPHYIAPAYPALAILTAVYAAEWIQGQRFKALGSLGLAWGFSPTNQSVKMKGALAPVLALAAIWAISILLTHSTLKSLHSANLAGPGLSDNREADALLRQADVEDAPVVGPLLFMREKPVQSIATLVFYARRPVSQVELASRSSAMPIDRYRFDPKPLDGVVGSEPRLILLDKSLVAQLPHQLLFVPIASSATLQLGTIARTPD